MYSATLVPLFVEFGDPEFGLPMCGGFSNMVLGLALLNLFGSALDDAAVSGRGGDFSLGRTPFTIFSLTIRVLLTQACAS